jgi:hypothetical protein
MYVYSEVLNTSIKNATCASLQERFIARISEAAKSQAGREKRTTVQKKDIREALLASDLYHLMLESSHRYKERGGIFLSRRCAVSVLIRCNHLRGF